MSYYVASWYKGVIKPEFADDMERIWQARDWAAAENELLSGMVEEGLDGDTEFIPIFDYLNNLIKGISENSYEKETRILRYGMAANIYGKYGRIRRNIFETILPLITERVISYYGWQEEMDHVNTDCVWIFKKYMMEVEKEFREKSFEKFLERLW